LVLRSQKRQIGQIRPQTNGLVFFQGDLTHSVNAMKSEGFRLSLVCEQYRLEDGELEDIPEFKLESRVNPAQSGKKRKS